MEFNDIKVDRLTRKIKCNKISVKFISEITNDGIVKIALDY